MIRPGYQGGSPVALLAQLKRRNVIELALGCFAIDRFQLPPQCGRAIASEAEPRGLRIAAHLVQATDGFPADRCRKRGDGQPCHG